MDKPQPKSSAHSAGFTLIEVLVSLFIILILMIGLYGLYILSLRITADNKMYVEAISLANQKMERIKNMPYRDVGVIGGVPSGTIPQTETVTRNGMTFTVDTYIKYYDDPFDGQAGSTTPDTIINDYKIVTVIIGWQSKYGHKEVPVFSKIIPRTEETTEGLGLLKIYVKDKDLGVVSSADVHIVNNAVSPIIDVHELTDSDGILYYPAPTSTPNTYQITVTKSGYGTDRSHNPSTSLTPYHLTLLNEGDKTEELFSISPLATLQIRTVTDSALPDNWQVNSLDNDRDKINPRFALDGADNLYFIWQSQTSTSSFVYLQKYNSAQTKQWANDLSLSSTQFQTNPDIAVTTGGQIFAVWQDNSATLKLLGRGSTNHRLVNKQKQYWSTKLAKKQANPLFVFTDNYNPNNLSINTQEIITTPRTTKANEVNFNFFANWKNKISRITNQVFKIYNQNLKTQPAKAAGNIVQYKISNVVNSGSSITATFDNPPTAGNVLIAIAMHRNNWTTFNAPYNSVGTFTESAYSNSSWYLDVGIWHKVAGAGEPSAVTITANNSLRGGILIIMEISGLDTTNLVNVTAVNDQTSNTSNTASVGPTALSTNNGFAIAAIGWGDDDFTAPNSSNWTSGSSDVWTQTFWQDWKVGWWWWFWWKTRSGSLAVATMDVSNAAPQSATLTLTGGGQEERNSVLVVFNSLNLTDIRVSATGTQVSPVFASTTNQYLGGAFVIENLTGTHYINSITIYENGTVDAANNLTNIKLFYDLDTTAPYDCASEQYDAGSDAQFGLTASNFNAANGSTTISQVGGVEISTTKTLCLYPVLDIGAEAAAEETIELYINNPSVDIVPDSGTVIPDSAVAIDGTTEIQTPTKLQQIRFRWRNDDGGEATSTWAAAENEDYYIMKNQPLRLRFEITNAGSLTSDPTAYQIEYGEKTTTCADITAWTPLPTNSSQHWQIINSAYLTDNESTSNLPDGLFDENTTFKPGYVKDFGNQTPTLTLTGDEFTEIEYSLQATTNANDATYCFRLTNAGSTDGFDYQIYPEISIVGDENIYIKSFNSDGNLQWDTKKVNTDATDYNQINPHIALTENFGSATSCIVWEDYRSGNNWDIYAQTFDATGNRLWTNDLAVAASSTDEYSPTIVIDSEDNILIAWVENSSSGEKIYLDKFDLTGTTTWPTAKNIISTPNSVYAPVIALDNEDNIYLAYTAYESGVENVYLAKFSSSTNLLWQKQANRQATTSNQYDPAIDLGGGYVYISWTDDRNSNPDIYAQKFNSNGIVQWSEDQRINIDIGTGIQRNSSLLINSGNKNFAVWEDARNEDFAIYAAEFYDPGTVAAVANVPLIVTGTKKLSLTPVIYEYQEYPTTDASGYVTLSVEWDNPGYTIETNPASTSLEVIFTNPGGENGKIPLEPGDYKTVYVYVE
jgi:prepilin-type N-terminal cleavage/methylation domain-containing protein